MDERRTDLTFDDLVASHYGRVTGWARRQVRDLRVAEDIVQETFLAATQAWDRFRGDANPTTWLYAIFRRKIADHYRRRSNRFVRLLEEPATSAPSYDATLDARRSLHHLEPSNLSAREQVLFERCLVRRESASEVAPDLDITPLTARVALSRMRAKLRARLEAKA